MNQPLHDIGFSLLPVRPPLCQVFRASLPVFSADAIADYACTNFGLCMTHNAVFPLHVCAASATWHQMHVLLHLSLVIRCTLSCLSWPAYRMVP